MEPNRYDRLYPRETYWAQVYHDSIRGKSALQELPLYIGNWAGNYAFFYILNRILDQYKPDKILELGLGESSKFINTYLKNYLQGNHTIIEHDLKWAEFVEGNFNFSGDTEILHVPMTQKFVDNHQINVYGQGLLDCIKGEKHNLYIADGPIGSEHFSRYDIVDVAEQNIEFGDQFIMLLDDNERIGERETRQALLDVLDAKGVKYYTKEHIGLKNIFLICTEDYKYVATF